MKIKCITNGSFATAGPALGELTFGREYDVISENDRSYRIKNDRGVEYGYLKGRFEVVEDVKPLLPTDASERKAIPLATGVLDYFPLALAEVAKLSKVGNDQHNPGQPLHWDKTKSTDHADTLMRHLTERGTLDTDGQRHSAKVAWRALALLQTELENDRAAAVVARRQLESALEYRK